MRWNVKTTYNGFLSSKHLLPQIWELVPQNFRRCESLDEFKTKIKTCHHSIFTVYCNQVALSSFAESVIIIFLYNTQLIYLRIYLFFLFIFFLVAGIGFPEHCLQGSGKPVQHNQVSFEAYIPLPFLAEPVFYILVTIVYLQYAVIRLL